MSDQKNLTTSVGAPVPDNENVLTAGPRGPMLLQDVWFLEKLAHFDREVIPERRMHAKGSGAFGTFTVTGDITRYTKAASIQVARLAGMPAAIVDRAKAILSHLEMNSTRPRKKERARLAEPRAKNTDMDDDMPTGEYAQLELF